MGKISAKDVNITYCREGVEYNFTCSECKRKVFIAEWERQKKCKCGVVYKVKKTLEIVGV